MKLVPFSALTVSFCTVLAFAEPRPAAGDELDRFAAPTHGAGPVALTDAEIDKVTAGDRVYFNYNYFNNSSVSSGLRALATFDAVFGGNGSARSLAIRLRNVYVASYQTGGGSEN